MKTAKKGKAFWVCLVVLGFFFSSSMAWADFYVIAAGKRAKRTVLVSPKNTPEESGTALLNALAAITDASETNPYLILLEPGIYTLNQTLVMKEHVNIAGSGENMTKLEGAISEGSASTSAIISGANNATLSSLTVKNTGGGTHSVALYNDYASPTVHHVTATAFGGTNSFGIYNNQSFPGMANVTATASGVTTSYGVYNYACSPTMVNVTASASNGTITNYGINNAMSSPTMVNVTATASGGASSYGVYNSPFSNTEMTDVTAIATGGTNNFGMSNYNSSHTMTDVTAKASGGTTNYGVYNQYCSIKIRRGTMAGAQGGLIADNSEAKVSQSTILGGVGVDGTGTNSCVACDDGEGNALDGNCNPIP